MIGGTNTPSSSFHFLSESGTVEELKILHKRQKPDFSFQIWKKGGIELLNKLIIDVNTASRCDCVESIDIGENTVVIEYKRTHFNTPKIQLTVTNYTDHTESSYEYDLDGPFTIPEEFYFVYGQIDFKYVDTNYIGTTFTIYTPGQYYYQKNLIINKIDDLRYELKTISTDQIKSVDTNSFTITDDGELSLQTPHEITVTVNDADLVTNVDFDYGDDYHKSFSVSWNDKNKISKFGEIPITWG